MIVTMVTVWKDYEGHRNRYHSVSKGSPRAPLLSFHTLTIVTSVTYGRYRQAEPLTKRLQLTRANGDLGTMICMAGLKTHATKETTGSLGCQPTNVVRVIASLSHTFAQVLAGWQYVTVPRHERGY